MSFIGNVPAESYSPVVKDTFSGNGSTTDFTLSIPATTNSVEVLVENVQQEPTSAYTIAGTTLSFTAAPVSGTNNIYVIHRGPAVQQVVPPAGVALNPSTVTATGDISTEGDLKVEVSSGGIYTITGTDTATDRTLTLPDEAGTVLTSASDIVPNAVPAFYATVSSDTGLTAAAYTVAPLDTEEFDTHSFFNTSTYRFTPTIAGYYQFGMTFGTTSSQVHLLQIRKNGSGTGATLHYDFGSTRFVSNAATLISLNGSTDYVDFVVRTENSSTLRASDTRAYGYLVRTI